MTNPIPPCPACVKSPTDHSDCVIGNDACKYCAGVHNDWGRHINHIWFVCINELGIETEEQLKAKVQPDPRVAVLEAEIDRLVEVNRRLVNERTVLLDVKTTDGLTASEWVMRTAIAESKLKLIAAQRGEVEG